MQAHHLERPWPLRRSIVVLLAALFTAAVAGSSLSSASANPDSVAQDASSFQPSAPITAAFLYPWFPKAWDQGVFPFTNYTPALGWYDSSDPVTIDTQLRLASGAGLDAFIASWWGPGHHTDQAMPALLDRTTRQGSPAPTMRWAIYYEEEGQSDPSVSKIVEDLRYLRSRYFEHPAYLRVDGKPVVFVWAEGSDGSSMAARWADAKSTFEHEVYIVLKVFSGYRTVDSQPDSWHQYGPAVSYDDQLPYSATVSPGFWLKGQPSRLVRDLDRFRDDVRRMRDSGAFWQLITTWNEWGEGTAVEPAAEFGTDYLDALAAILGGGSITPPTTALPPTTAADTNTDPTTTSPPTTAADTNTDPTTALPPTTAADTNTDPTTTSPPTVTEPRSIVVEAEADAHVISSAPNRRFGDRLEVRVDGSPQRHTYMRFMVPEGMTPTKAVLRIYANSRNRTGFDVHLVEDNSWDEKKITFNNAPAMGQRFARHGRVHRRSWVEVDVSSAITSDGYVTLGLSSISRTQTSFKSRESGRAPQLIITSESGPATEPQPDPTTTTTTTEASTTTTALSTTTAKPTTTKAPSSPTTGQTTTTAEPTTTTTDRSTTTAPTLPPTGGSIVFTAGGDFGANSKTDASLAGIAQSGASFHLALGDLSYSDLSEAGWCDFVEAHLGVGFPMPLIVGNHEDDDRPDGYIGNFASCLPDRMNSVGIYAAEYYFDVGPARVILIGAGNDVAGEKYDYEKGNTHYAWLSTVIDDARTKLIPWVIVGMHKVCITAGNKPCEIGSDLMDLLIDKQVDVVLHGHDHDYQRSKQLTCAVVNSYQADCVADDGSDGQYNKGAGTMFVIAGTMGGGGLTPIDTSDREYPYFAATMGGDDPDGGRGFLAFELSSTDLVMRFVGSTTNYSDTITIR